jgi:signal transduction histidine kinase
MNLKTSTKISLKFTLLTVVIVFLFWLFANILFLQRWYGPLKNSVWLIIDVSPQKQNNMWIFREHFKRNLTINTNSNEHQELLKNIYFKNIWKINDNFFYFQEAWNKVVVLDVTQQINAQRNLMNTTIYLLILFWVLSYFISLYFVKSSLVKLNDLVDHVKKLNVDNLHNRIKIMGPDDDEINILAIKINEALEKINKQTNSLKDFVSNASHEFKTPLMTISTEIDYAIKSKKHKEWLENIKIEILSLNNLLDELVLISKIDSEINLKKEKKNISEILEKNLKSIEKNYEYKKIKLIKNIDNIDKFIHNSSFDIISKNLIENAFKYTEKWKIEVILNEKEFVVKDTGIWIEKKNLDKIWERFWQEDSSKTDKRSFGLGLYLTKLLAEKHDWNIEVRSEKWEGSEFKILF